MSIFTRQADKPNGQALSKVAKLSTWRHGIIKEKDEVGKCKRFVPDSKHGIRSMNGNDKSNFAINNREYVTASGCRWKASDLYHGYLTSGRA
jgi:hypothetical protein